MKVLAVLLSLSAAAYAIEIDWANLTPREVYPAGFENLASGLNSRIVGGTEAAIGQFPFQAALFILVGTSYYFCGGSLIKDDVVLTAAHCVDGASEVIVMLGTHNIYNAQPGEQEFLVTNSAIKIHPLWDTDNIRNDIALIRLPQKAQLGETVQTIALASDPNQLYEGQTCRASGWGKTSDSASSISDVLNFVDLPVITNDECRNSFGSYILPSNVCVSGAGRKSTCNGDSGGPLVYDSPNGKVVIGLTSFGSGWGCSYGFPAVFTGVTSYLDWIKTNADM